VNEVPDSQEEVSDRMYLAGVGSITLLERSVDGEGTSDDIDVASESRCDPP
jgi:hypothetical protein